MKPAPPPDVSSLPSYSAEQVVEIVYSRHQHYRAVITTDQDSRFRLHRDHWDTSDWDIVGSAYWNQDDHHATITDTIDIARKLAREALASTPDGYDEHIT